MNDSILLTTRGLFLLLVFFFSIGAGGIIINEAKIPMQELECQRGEGLIWKGAYFQEDTAYTCRIPETKVGHPV